MFARHAAGTAEVELALHESLLTELGIQAIDAMPVAPTTQV
jgi:thiaminase/transcriptional activator TenA